MELRIDRAKKARALLLLAHGAGAGMDQPFLLHIAQGLAQHGITVVRFEFAYMAARREGRRLPPERLPALEARFTEAVAAVKTKKPLLLAGKSMGGRIATRVADVLKVRGVLAYGYPFHPPQKPSQTHHRVEHLSHLATPCLIVQGTRDPFGTPSEVAAYPLAPTLRVHWLEDGDHSLVPRKQSGHTSAAHMREAIEVSAQFVTQVLSGRTG